VFRRLDSALDSTSVLQELILQDVTVAQALSSLESYQSGLGRSATLIGPTMYYAAGAPVTGLAIMVS
jgi:hypothetical protein